MRSALFGASLLAATLLATAAHATDPAAAQGLFSEGKRLMTAGEYNAACGKFEESQKLDPGIGTQFHLATCYQQVGRVASAWANFLDVAAAARAAGQTARETVARQRAAALEPRLSKMVVIARDVQSIAGLTITRDGAVVGRGQWGSAVPVDPGPHTIAANAPGKKSWEATVRVLPEGKLVAVEVPRLEDVPAPAPPPPVPITTPPAPRFTATSSPPPETPETGSTGSTQRAIGLVIAGVGIVGLGVGAYYGIQSKNKGDESNAHCAGNRCDATGVSLREDALRAGDISTASFGVGGAVILGGLIVALTAPHAPPASREARRSVPTVSPMVGKGVSGLTLVGAF